MSELKGNVIVKVGNAKGKRMRSTELTVGYVIVQMI